MPAITKNTAHMSHVYPFQNPYILYIYIYIPCLVVSEVGSLATDLLLFNGYMSHMLWTGIFGEVT